MIVEPKLIELARLAAGLTQGQVAQRIGKTQGFVSQVENGTRSLPADMLKAWAAACEVDPSFFRRTEGPPPIATSGIVHRRMKTLPAKPYNRTTSRARMACMEVDSLFSEVDVVPSLELPTCPNMGPADAADEVRRMWRMPDGPLGDLTATIEAAGVPILLLDGFHEKHSAISQPGRWVNWLIALNPSEPASRRRYSLSHEFGHVALCHDRRTVMEADDDEAAPIADAQILEDEADAFAAALLLPEDDAKRELRNPDLRRLVMLKQRWRVSIAFLIRRAHNLGLIGDDRRRQLYIQLSTLPGGRKREPNEFEPEEPQLIRRIVESLTDNGMTLGEVAELMTISEEKLRVGYLGERPRLQALPDRPRRAVVTLPRPGMPPEAG